MEVLCRQIKISKLFPVSHDIFEPDQHALGNCAQKSSLGIILSLKLLR